jgi:hypothetical protein
VKNRRFIGPLGKFSHRNEKLYTRDLSLLIIFVLCQLLNKFRYMVSEEIDFEISQSDLLSRLCDDRCSHQNFSLTFDFTRLRLGLQIGNFGIIAQGSCFPEIALQNCKSDMTPPPYGGSRRRSITRDLHTIESYFVAFEILLSTSFQKKKSLSDKFFFRNFEFSLNILCCHFWPAASKTIFFLHWVLKTSNCMKI